MADSLRTLAEDLAAGRTTPGEVARECVEHIAGHDEGVRAWVSFDGTAALQRAQSCRAGPLSGIPFGVKDIYDTADLPTEWGSEVYSGRRPSADAALVAELKALGGYVLGKTHTTAFAYYDPAPTRNPHNLEHTPGGSSSGSAAAVAAGMVPFALGSQTQGSVLRPASFCGVVGFKPSRGVLPVAGMLPCSPALDTAGYFARTVDDVRFVWDVLRPGEETATAKRIVVMPWPPAKDLEPGTAELICSAMERLAAAGMIVEEGQRPESFEGLPRAVVDVMAYEAAQTHAQGYEEHGTQLGEKLAELIESGRRVSEAEYRSGLSAMARAEEEFADWAGTVVATPASLGPAPKGLASTGDPVCNLPWTGMGSAAISIPCGAVAGLPLGLQLTAPAGRDRLLLATAAKAEEALG